ncbi:MULTISPECIES: hypothetical protein [unclassified Rhizobium]|uniref:hypothetical protein n=1 Tax=unclassified Rhizobium TaxID=2613769 RepID=UPI001ADAFF8A|nr:MULTISPECIES: hypothetical protein [unclassified Rhizobium]MBO9123813.1 hypothetical protein [Rhizobium sp. 16-488-2b]MBO9174345.1 hypothetical protein [Rhizobium sp. 16-488-2a]
MSILASNMKICIPSGLRDEAGAILWAADELVHALELHDVRAEIVSAGAGADVVAEVDQLSVASREGLLLPLAPESLALIKSGEQIFAWGSDIRGLVYALTELADRVRTSKCGELFAGTFPLVETPTARVRSMARLFCAEHEDKVWFYSKNQWREYLSMLASNRFNRFSLTLGMGYNYPYHNPWISDVYFYFPYPFLFSLPGYNVDVKELPADERELNLETLKFIGREAARRGLEFQLALWTQRYDFDDVPNANYTVRGVTSENLAPYCRDAITHVLKEVPQITGLTFRVHVEGGIAEGEYGFWETAFSGVAACGRPVEIDMHGKGLDFKLIDLARRSGMPVAASPKYLAEHMALPYHQSAIRDREHPPEQARSAREKLSEGSRKFLRYSYGDLLDVDKDYKVIYRIWPGTQRVLLWGDPAFAAGYSRSSMFAGSDGVEWCEPQSFKGRMGTAVPGQRFSYQKRGLPTAQDWKKYEYQYRVWGRRLYNPESPSEGWMRWLDRECGEASEACEQGLSWASRVLPLITLAHGPSASNNHYWPEIYTNLGFIEGEAGGRAYGFDMEGPTRFGNAPTFDPVLFANAREYAEALLSGKAMEKYSPLDVADWLDEMSAGCNAAADTASSAIGWDRAETQRIVSDVKILGAIAGYFAERFRAACWAELFIATKATSMISPLVKHATKAVEHWRQASSVSKGLYHDDITYGPQSWLRGSWHSRLPEMEAELLDLVALQGYGGTESVPADGAASAAAKAINGHKALRRHVGELEYPEEFTAGEPLRVRHKAAGDAAVTLHYRHVNQAERWETVAMERSGDTYLGEIPGAYTATKYHLQFFISYTSGGEMKIIPGLAPDLANEPYATSLQRGANGDGRSL